MALEPSGEKGARPFLDTNLLSDVDRRCEAGTVVIDGRPRGSGSISAGSNEPGTTH
jgi:hypothetical protein